MNTEKSKTTRKMPKGGRKGGSVFPRISLNDAVGYANKLVSKTHVSPQPKDVILSGVVGAKTGIGDVRISALKQYGFMKGDVKSDFTADELAKKIASAPHEELVSLYRQAILKPSIFKKLFDTYHGDQVTKAKLKQRAADLKVHPDETSACVELYIAGMEMAQLISVEGDQVTHVSTIEIANNLSNVTDGEPPQNLPQNQTDNEKCTDESSIHDESGNVTQNAQSSDDEDTVIQATQVMPKAIFNVNVTLDSSLDTEKLQKQLELLKRFGAI
jgi:hypothetical protein